MPWFKVDDGFWSHPKVLDLSNDALALWLKAGTYSAQHLTDGFVKRAVVRMVGGTDDAAEELVSAELWDIADGGYQFHDWLRYQPSAEETREKRAEISAKRSEAGAKGAASRWQNDGKTDSKSDGKPMAPTRPDPTRPIPDQKKDQTLIVAERADVTMLCTLLADLIEGNGSKRPTIGKGWLDAARLMIDNDHRTVEDAAALIRWCQQDEFWRGNILSMPKFREKYDQLRLASQKRRSSLTAVEHNMDLYLREKARMEAEQGNPMREIGGVA